MRAIAALGVLAAVAVISLSLPVKAEECVSKDAHLALMGDKYPKAINTDLDGVQEQIFLANLSRVAGEDYTAYDAMIHRHPGVSSTLIVLFKDGCAALKGELPNEAVTKLLDGREA